MTRLRAVLAIFCLLLPVAPVAAHTLSVSHLDVVVAAQGDALHVELDVALKDVALSLPLDANRDDQVTWGEVKAIQPQLQDWVLAGLRITSRGRECELTPDRLAIRHYDEGAYATLVMTAQCDSPETLAIHYGLLFDVDPQHRALVTLRQGTRVSTLVLSKDKPDAEFGAASAHPFFAFLREGIHHILIGYDHLAFLLSLLLPAALIRSRQKWAPVATLRESFGHVLGIVTAFTVAHSVTLSLAALGWITPASRWVESAIAFSVLLAAMNNVFPLVVRRIWMVGFGFGLVHGFGFAGALSELGLPDGARLTALVGFNLGVEIGQLAVVAVVLPVLFLLRRQRWYARIAMPLVSIAIALLAAYWMYQRLSV